MPRLYHSGEWFYELSPTALGEKEFEQLLVANAAVLKPNFWVVPYSRTVYADDGKSARADLAFIDKQYREWFVIEVEMNRHPLHGHVIPQVRTLANARYGEADATYLAGKQPELSESLLAEMIRVSQPDVLVIANKPDAVWDRELERLGVHQMILELYRSERSRHIFVVDGELPVLATNLLSMLEVDPLLSNMVVVRSPAPLGVPTGGILSLFWQDQITEWGRVDIADTCYLHPKARMPLARGRTYGLYSNPEGHLIIKELGA